MRSRCEERRGSDEGSGPEAKVGGGEGLRPGIRSRGQSGRREAERLRPGVPVPRPRWEQGRGSDVLRKHDGDGFPASV